MNMIFSYELDIDNKIVIWYNFIYRLLQLLWYTLNHLKGK